jgi:hypothetical protein
MEPSKAEQAFLLIMIILLAILMAGPFIVFFSNK